MAWYKTGKEGLENDIAEGTRKDGVRRLWMPKGSSKTIVFLDDEAFRYWEHNMYLDGSWRNWFVCPKKNMSEDCAICDAGFQPYFVGFYTVIDKTGFKDRAGNMHKDMKLLFPAKIPVLEKLKRQSEKRGGLAGCVFEVTRGSGNKSSSVGDDFDFMEKVKPEDAFPGVDVTPFVYPEVFNVEPNDKLKLIIENSKKHEADADDVPY